MFLIRRLVTYIMVKIQIVPRKCQRESAVWSSSLTASSGDLVQIENHPLQLITVEPVVGQPLTARSHGSGLGHQVLLKPNPLWGLRGIP